MKQRFISVLLLAVLLLGLCGCAKYPETALDGTAWNRDWVMLGTVLGVEEPGNGFVLNQNASVLTGQDTYYATWTVGEPTDYVNEDGKTVDLFPAQIYLLLYGCVDENAAEQAIADWMGRQQDSYTVESTEKQSINGVDYSILHYRCGSDTNPYDRGASAYGRYGAYVVSAEVTCVEEYEGDPAGILTDFLQGCHYGG